MGGNGDFGMETLTVGSDVTGANLTVASALVAGINDTYYYAGLVGVGAIPGNFGGKKVNPLLNQLVETLGAVPSHSYGYTAGAPYREFLSLKETEPPPPSFGRAS